MLREDYGNVYNLEEVYDLEDNYWWFKAKRDLLFKTVKKLTKNLGTDVHLLDGGCGSGANLKAIQDLLPAIGIEKYEDGLKLCKRRNLNNLLSAELEHLPFKHGTFDIVLAMDVLEHVEDDLEVLKEISRVSKENSILIVHVPAFKFLWCDHDIAVNHKRRYTVGELVEQLKKSDFKVKSINYRLCSFFLLGILRKYLIIIKKLIKKNSKPQTYRPKVGMFVNNILFSIIKMEDYFLNFIRLPFGLSIFCIAQKKNTITQI